MISDITLGQFFPGKSILHRLDPRTKILMAILFIVGVFLANNPAAFLVLILTVVLLVAISKISFSVIFKGIKPIILILIFTAIINLLMTGGEGDPLLSFWIIKIYTEGIVRAVFMAIRVVLLIVGIIRIFKDAQKLLQLFSVGVFDGFLRGNGLQNVEQAEYIVDILHRNTPSG